MPLPFPLIKQPHLLLQWENKGHLQSQLLPFTKNRGEPGVSIALLWHSLLISVFLGSRPWVDSYFEYYPCHHFKTHQCFLSFVSEEVKFIHRQKASTFLVTFPTRTESAFLSCDHPLSLLVTYSSSHPH